MVVVSVWLWISNEQGICFTTKAKSRISNEWEICLTTKTQVAYEET